MQIERNELNQNAKGGSELMLERLYSSLPPDLLSNFQIIPSRVRAIDPSKSRVLWLQDLPNDPESEHLRDPELRKRFHCIVANSNWQLQMYNTYLGVPYSQSVVLRNAITPIEITEKAYDGTIRIVYHTTPHRGLELLIPVFEQLAERYDNIELDVFSSFAIYGWAERDRPYQELFERCKNHPKIRYHGSVDNATIREHLKTSHIFAYPCIWPETSCLAAIEALSAMNIIVCPNYAVLPETTGGFAAMYQWHEDPNAHITRFAATLEWAIQNMAANGPPQARLRFQKQWCDMLHDWGHVKNEWEGLLRKLAKDREYVTFRTS